MSFLQWFIRYSNPFSLTEIPQLSRGKICLFDLVLFLTNMSILQERLYAKPLTEAKHLIALRRGARGLRQAKPGGE